MDATFKKVSLRDVEPGNTVLLGRDDRMSLRTVKKAGMMYSSRFDKHYFGVELSDGSFIDDILWPTVYLMTWSRVPVGRVE